MSYSLIAVYLTSISLLIATPGPVVALVLHSAAQNGLRQAAATILGTNGASLVLICIATFIISGAFVINNMMLTWISLFGCLFIGWLALQGLRSHCRKPQKKNSQSSNQNPLQSFRTNRHAFLNGFLVGIANPKDIIFFVAFFPQFVGVTSHLQVSLALLTFMWIVCDFLILVIYATVANAEMFQHVRPLISVLSSSFLLFIAVAGFIYAAFAILG